jgi:hypothetical protein
MASRRRLDLWTTALKIVGYIWRVITNLFYLAVVLYALDRLHGRTETLIISTLGLIYVTIRTMAWGQFLATLGVTAGLQMQLDTIQARLDGTFDPMSADEIEASRNTWHVKWIIDMIFLAIISLFCLLTFFMGLSRSV